MQCSFDANYENAEFDTVLNYKSKIKTEEKKTTQHKNMESKTNLKCIS